MSEIFDRLEACLQNKDLPESARSRAKLLFESLSRPVIVAVLGPSKSGKSTLINLILKDRLIPGKLSCNVVEIVHGPEFTAEATFVDGSIEALEQVELKRLREADRISVAAPNDVLKNISLVEASGSIGKIEDAIDHAVEQADLVLWCTTDFEEAEQKLWKRVDERFRDHAFLVLTHADKLARRRKLAEALAALTPHADGDFAGLMPIATLQALKALDAEPVDEDLWAGSGADGLLARIQDHVRRGRQADLDQAELFLARFAAQTTEEEEDTGVPNPGRTKSKIQRRRRSRMTRDVVEAMRNAASEEEAASASEEAASETPSEPATEAEDEATAKTPSSRVVTRPLEEPEVLEVTSKSAPKTRVPSASLADRLDTIRTKAPDTPQTTDETASLALGQIGKAAAALVRLKDEPEKVLDLCNDTADGLQDLFDKGAVAADVADLRDEVLQTREHMTLLQLEKATGSAADAVTLLLQLKRDFEARIAA